MILGFIVANNKDYFKRAVFLAVQVKSLGVIDIYRFDGQS